MPVLVVLVLVIPPALAFLLGYLQFMISLFIKDRVIRALLLLPLPGLTLITGGALFYRFLHLPPSFLGPMFSDTFFCFLCTVVILLGILTGWAMGARRRKKDRSGC